MDKLMTAIENCSLLQALPPKLVHNYYNEGHILTKSYGKNEILHFEGEPCDQLEIIVNGQIAVERIDESGKVLTIALFGVGKNLGANLLFSSHPQYPMTASAKTHSEVLVLKKSLIFELCNIYSEFLLQFLEVISDHTVILGVKVKDHVSRTIRESIIAFINNEYNLQNNKTLILTTSKKALAERMGVSRTSLSRELQKMKLDHLIDYDNKSIKIIDQSILNNQQIF